MVPLARSRQDTESSFSATSPAQSTRTALKYVGVAGVSAAPNGWGRLSTNLFSCRPYPPRGAGVFLSRKELRQVWERSSFSGLEVALVGRLGDEPMGRPSLRVGESNFLRNGPSATTIAFYIFAHGYVLWLHGLIPPR
jgi:hypothetical protein